MLHDPEAAAAAAQPLDAIETAMLARCGQELAPAQRARAVHEAASHYEVRHHATAGELRAAASNKVQGKGNATDKIAAAFSELAAPLLGTSARNVRRWRAQGRDVAADVIDRVAETPRHGQGVLLERLAKVSMAEQAGELAKALARLTDEPVPTGEVFETGNLTIRCADSRPWMAERIAEGRLYDAIVTDWPYGVGWKAASHRPIANDERIPLWAVSQFASLLRRDGRLVLFTSEKVVFRTQRELASQGLTVRCIIEWDKVSNFFKSRPSELILVADLDPAPSPIQYTTWQYEVPRAAEDRQDSPTPKPVGMMERLLPMVSNRGDEVLDPFMGGTAPIAIAAHRLGRTYTGVEIVPKYFEAAKRRVQKVARG